VRKMAREESAFPSRVCRIGMKARAFCTPPRSLHFSHSNRPALRKPRMVGRPLFC
jgi:hypothetical protein